MDWCDLGGAYSPTEDEWTSLVMSGDADGVREFEHKSGRKAAVDAIWALQALLDAKRAMN